MMERIKKAFFASKYYTQYKLIGTVIGQFLRLCFLSFIKNCSIARLIENDNRLSLNEKNEIQAYVKLHISNTKYSQLEQDYFDNECFFVEYGSAKYDVSQKMKAIRTWEYTHRYHMGTGCWVNAGVHFLRNHLVTTGTLNIGKNCIFSGSNKIDYSGGLIIENGVVINHGVDILTHGHQYIGERNDYFENESHAYISPLIIHDNVMIGANALILPNVREIGENSIIMAGVVVSRPVPANCIVSQQGTKSMPEGIRTLFMYKQE